MESRKKEARFKVSVASSVNASFNEPVLLTDDLTTNIVQAAKMKYQGIEIHVQNPGDINVQMVREACSDNHICISGIATGLAYAKEGLCLIHEDKKIREKTIIRLKRFVDLARELQTVILIGRLKGDIADMSRYEYYEHMLADGLGLVAEYAREAGVTLMLEAINRYESNYMNKVGEVSSFIHKYHLPATKVLMDVFHMNMEEADIAGSIREYFAELGYFHIADSNRMYPGAGHVEYEPIFGVLVELGYEGYVSLECLRRPHGELAAREGRRFVETMMKKNEKEE